jgi:predicted phage tail protein
MAAMPPVALLAAARDRGDAEPRESNAAQDTDAAAIAERQASDQDSDRKESRSHGWRRITSAENAGLAGAVATAADVTSEFFIHGIPVEALGAGGAALGVFAAFRTRVDRRKGRA